MKYLFYLLIALVSFASCKKTASPDKEVTGTLVDYTGRLDGCGILIELDKGARLEIHSLPAGTVLIPGKRVAVTFTEAKNVFSICMAGTIADITSLRYL